MIIVLYFVLFFKTKEPTAEHENEHEQCPKKKVSKTKIEVREREKKDRNEQSHTSKYYFERDNGVFKTHK